MGGCAVFPHRHRSRSRRLGRGQDRPDPGRRRPGAVGDIHAEADRTGLSPDQRAAADRACRYLENNAVFVHYDKALDAGWPIASGIVEGTARHLIADRLDITGGRWSVCGAEAVLTLRAVISNGDFPQYWTFHTCRERERLCPAPDQAESDLTA